MSWQVAILTMLALVLIGGAVWFERSRPPARIVAAVAALAALGIAGRLVLAPIPNVVATTDVALLAGYSLGPAPGFAVGALSALISNFWLGQGPWTPWQMAGWGLVGIGGAALAVVTARRLGRGGLAVAAGLAGLLYGALLDLSVMVNFGGEQSLDRYLALSVRGIPFNVAHAAGNVVLMLAAGPAIVRMLDRYRERFAVRWHDSLPSRPRAAATSTLALIAGLGLILAAGPAPPPVQAASGATSWMLDARNGDGGWGTEPGSDSSPGMTGWAVLGIEAAGINPLDVGGARTPIDYLRANAGDLGSTGDLERTILAVRGAGLDPRSFAGRDLVAELRARRDSDASWDDQVNLTAFAILAQRAAGIGSGELGKSAAWLRGAQNDDGGWGSTRNGPSEPDSTGAALQALDVAPGGSSEMRDGARWLERAQRGDGGFSLIQGAASNAQSTAWAVQGLIAAGVAPGGVANGGNDPFDYLASVRDGDGHYRYSRSSDQTPVWVTAQVLTAIEGEPFPIEPVPRDPSSGKGSAGESSSGDGQGAAAAATAAARKARKAEARAERRRERRAEAAARDDRRGSNEVAAATVAGELAAEEAPESSLPATPVLLGGLGGLAGALGLGFLWYRRRLP